MNSSNDETIKRTGIRPDSKINEKYKIIRSIGSGGMGSVFQVRVKNSEKNISYALKFLNNIGNSISRERFRNEVQLLKKINHKHIPKIIEDYEDDFESYYVMEYIDGETLYSLLKKTKRISIHLANNYIRQIAETLGELHSRNIIHRDLKSQNIMISKDHDVKILDLGISVSRDTKKLTRENSVVCSPYYAAPEFLNPKLKKTKAVDIYSLGILYFEMLTGNYPFSGKTDVETILMHRDKEFPEPTKFVDLPNSVRNIIIKATAKDPKDRYNDVWEFRKDVKTSLNEERKIEKLISIKTIKPKKTIEGFINSPIFLGVSLLLIIVSILVVVILLKVWNLI
ncbi:serine/threonine protein kinase [Mycoplasma sp. CSL10137]|uniref:serine/threonine-protein kinase n=1 Tax=unclassified Mycoplasma TaxID=2683645 RepID=UPI00197C8536|nr:MULTISPECIES: serine/threonine-protein kinase [unclassified Mycoplasma]MBN4083792.1 serine/threonine protein kinase [Mycoplasma sp. CSL10137]MBN4084229.1 serine/threonine protein kinase [Mycoplasma sp. CSL10166]MBU4692690.1 serine/threonine protein kinase [Mycoplasma sp. CSL7491-lung]